MSPSPDLKHLEFYNFKPNLQTRGKVGYNSLDIASSAQWVNYTLNKY